MQGKIALEEHFAIPDTLEDSHGYFPDRVWQEVKSRVMDIHERRLREMDQNGIELMLLSLMRRRCRRSPMRSAQPRSPAKPMTISPNKWPSARIGFRDWRRWRCRTRKVRRASSSAASRS